MLSKNIFHIDLLSLPIHLSFCLLLETLWPLLEKEAAHHTTNSMLFLPPNNLIDPPPLLPCVTGIKNATALQGQEFMCGKSASEHNFSGVGCNFRVFQGICPGANKIQGFQGLRGFFGHPAHN